jgi:hypothetical protein
LAEILDDVRKDAPNNIIPNAHLPIRRAKRLAKLQPPTPGKITERTGTLLRMIKAGIGNWKRGPRMFRNDGPALQGEVKVTTKGNNYSENYQAVLRANIKVDSQSFGLKGFMRETRQQLFMRFKWETGIRGQRRPFLEPSANKSNLSKAEQFIKARTQALSMMR